MAQAPPRQPGYSGAVLGFEVNRGQSDPRVKFLSRGKGYVVFLTSDGAVLSLPGDDGGRTTDSAIRLKLVGANPEPVWTGLDALPSLSHYFLGNDPSRWITCVPAFAKVRLQEIYQGVDVIFYERAGELEYDFTLSPHADPGVIRLNFEGARSVGMDAEGALILQTRRGAALHMRRPVVYQPEEARGRRVIDARYVLGANGSVSFQLASYERSKPLIIDPVLTYSTYLGGSGNDNATAVATDSSGNVYVAGSTTSADFPLANPFKGAKPGTQSVFVAKLNPAGSAYVYSTYIGGSGNDSGMGIAVDAGGYVSVTGATTSPDFPVVSALQPALAGARNAFVVKLNAAGSGLVYSTYLGGSGSDQGNGIAMDSAGSAYVTGAAGSTNFPTFHPLQPASAGPANGSDAFVAKINPAGTAYIYSTYLGGSGSDTGRAIAVDFAGNAYVTGDTSSKDFPRANAFQPALAGGMDAFVSKINAAGSALVYSSYLGGGGNDTGRGIAVDRSGNAYLTGATGSPDFPLANALQPALAGGSDAFAAKVIADGSGMAYSSYFGGSADDFGLGIAVDGAGNAYVTGLTSSINFPTMNAVQATRGGGRDAFVMELGAGGSNLVWSTYLGGTNDDAGAAIAADIAGNIYVAGATSSNDFPTALAIQPSSAGGQDAFVARIIYPQNLVPAVNLSASSLIFNAQFVGRTSPAQTVTLTNGGAAPLSILGITASGDFRQTNACGATLAPGANCAISITFNPALAGARTGAVTVIDNAQGTPHIVTLSASGLAPVPQINLSTVTTKPGGAGFTLKVTGSGFVPGAVVNWNGSPRQTTYISTTQLNAAILAADVAGAGTAEVTVSNPVQFGPTLSNRSAFLTGTGRGVTASQWPQPNLILYNREDASKCNQVHTVQPDGTGDVCLTCGATGFGGGIAFHNGKVSPDGSWILMQVTMPGGGGCASPDGGPGTGNNQEIWLAAYPNISSAQTRVSPACSIGRCQNLIPIWNPQQTMAAFGSRQVPCVNPGPPACAMKLAIADLNFANGVPSLVSTSWLDPNGADPGIVEPWSWKPDGNAIWYAGQDAAHPYPFLTVNSVRLSDGSVTELTPWTGASVWNEFPAAAANGSGLFFSSSRTSPSECPLAGCPSPLFALDELGFMSFNGAKTSVLTGLNIPGSPDYAGGIPSAANGITPNPAGTQGLIDQEIPGAPKWITMAGLLWPPNGVSNAVSFQVANPVDGIAFGKIDVATGSAPGFQPAFVTSGDFNGDGKPDLAAANGGASTVSIMPGNGDGTFGAHQEFATGPNPAAIVAGDFNGDGKLDLAIANNGAPGVSILLGNGDGTFQAHADYAAGNNPSSIVTGDFNLDGKLDLAVANKTDGTVSLFLGNGDGTFQPRIDIPAGAAPSGLIAADFNGDTVLDLAVVNNKGAVGPSAVSILLGNGNGSFRPRVEYATGTASAGAAAGDFNGDGRLDLAVANAVDGTVSVLLGNRNGSFQTHADYRTAAGPAFVTAGDFNADGKLDLAASAASGMVSILFGAGDGTFQPHVDVSAGIGSQLATADFNADGRADFATAGAGGSVAVLLQSDARPSTLALSPAATYGGITTTGNGVSLSSPAPPGGATVLLSSSNPVVAAVPSSVTVPAGASVSPGFSIVTTAVTAPSTVTITAAYGGVAKTANLTVVPAVLYGLQISPSGIGGGLPAKSNSVALAGAAPSGGAVIALSSSNPAVASVPLSVTIAADQKISPVFAITTTPVSVPTPVTITASYGGSSKTGTLTVNPAVLYAVSLAATSLTGGTSTTANLLILNGLAPAGGAVIGLSSSNAALASVPASVTVPQGSYFQPFTITTSPTASAAVVTLSASWNGATASSDLTVTPTN